MTAPDLHQRVEAAVRLMREHQRAYLGGRDKSHERLAQAKAAERDVDRILADLERGQGRLL